MHLPALSYSGAFINLRFADKATQKVPQLLNDGVLALSDVAKQILARDVRTENSTPRASVRQSPRHVVRSRRTYNSPQAADNHSHDRSRLAS